MARTPQEVFDHHAHALVTGNLDELVADYADDAVLITPSGVARGKDSIRAAFDKQISGLPANAVFDVKTRTFAGDVLLLEWVLDSPAERTDGVDTFVFADGLIRIQTVSHTSRPKG